MLTTQNYSYLKPANVDRSFAKHAEKGGYPGYFGEPHATISPTGTRIVFGSDWYDLGSVDSYVIELPSFVRK